MCHGFRVKASLKFDNILHFSSSLNLKQNLSSLRLAFFVVVSLIIINLNHVVDEFNISAQNGSHFVCLFKSVSKVYKI